MARRTINSLILPMALVGFRLFGHTSTQFMIVWPKNLNPTKAIGKIKELMVRRAI